MSKAVGPKNPSGRRAEPPLEVLPISVRIPLAQNSKLPHTTLRMREGIASELRGMRTCCLLIRSLLQEAVSSILWDSNLKRADAMSVKKALALSLKGVASLCLDAFICSFYL